LRTTTAGVMRITPAELLHGSGVLALSSSS
jgi:hypothetical protein